MELGWIIVCNNCGFPYWIQSELKPMTQLNKPIGEFRGEYFSKGSRFLALGFEVSNVVEVKAILDRLKKEPDYRGANHFCYAYRLGCPVKEIRANDDGEPSGTAGKPILGQIESSQLSETLIVVIRFFGGTLLGTGGLIQSYREAAKAAIKNAETLPYKELKKWVINGDFQFQNQVESICVKNNAHIDEKSFENGFCFHISVTANEEEKLIEKLGTLFNGKVGLKRAENINENC